MHIPCCLHFYARNFSYRSRADFVFLCGVFLLTHPLLALVLSAEFLLYILRQLYFSVGSFSCSSHAGFFSFIIIIIIFLSGEFLLHIPCWFLLLSGVFLLHIPCWLHFYLGGFSSTSSADFIFIWGVSLTHPVLTPPPPPPPPIWGVSLTHLELASFLFGEFLLHFPCWLFIIWGFSLTHPILASYLGSFSYTSRAGYIFLFFYLGSFCYTSHVSFIFFSYTSRAGFIFIW